MNQQQTQTTDANLQLLQQYNLGNFRKMYEGSGWGCLAVLAVFVFVCINLVLVFFAQAREHLALDASGVAGTIAFFSFVLLVLVGLLVGLLIGIYHNITNGRLNAYLYDNGFICCTSKGIVQQVVRWTDVIVFQHKVVERSSSNVGGSGIISTTYNDVYTVTLRNTEKPVELGFGKEFAHAVEQEVANWQYPAVKAIYQSGNAVQFGRLSVRQRGLHDTVKGTTLHWSEVESIKAYRHGAVHIKKRGERRDKWIYFAIGEFNNPEVFRRLVAADVPYSFEFSF